jgi:hypothetical protein
MTTLIIGNGVNIYLKSRVLSWEELLKTLWKEFKHQQLRSIPQGISNTEIMELLFLDETINIARVKKRISSLTKEWESDFFKSRRASIQIKTIQENLKSKKIISTNFDSILPELLGLEFHTYSKSISSDVYPWSSYYGNGKNKLWFMHGSNHYSRSIRIGFNDYHNAISKARNILKSIKKKGNLYIENDKHFAETFLKDFLEDDLIFIGLSLGPEEFFIRWLLFFKKKHYPDTHVKYLLTKKSREGQNIDFLFSSLGYAVKEFENYDELYNGIDAEYKR